MQGTIFDIMRYSLHDGPGIRTTVFLKGCPLTCWWCHNPESQSSASEIMHWKERCMGCGDCRLVCSCGLDARECIRCGVCVEVCPTCAREMVGKRISVDELIKEIEKDRIFYEESGGGVTFSGGEPLLQYDFLLAALNACRIKGYHTCVDTSGYTAPDRMANIAERCDLFLYDLKIMDDRKHQQYTGVSNHWILQNLRLLHAKGAAVVVRFPLIPGINDDQENIVALGTFLQEVKGIQGLEILPYHCMGSDKYGRIAQPYRIASTKEPAEEELQLAKRILESMDIHVRIGGRDHE